jgi:hypothetical protein
MRYSVEAIDGHGHGAGSEGCRCVLLVPDALRATILDSIVEAGFQPNATTSKRWTQGTWTAGPLAAGGGGSQLLFGLELGLGGGQLLVLRASVWSQNHDEYF